MSSSSVVIGTALLRNPIPTPLTIVITAGTGQGSKLTLTHTFGNTAVSGPILVNFGNGLFPLLSGAVQVGQLSNPGAPTVTPVSTGGGGTSTTWSYVIVALDLNGFTTAAGSTGTTAAGSSTLDNSGTQQNNLTWTAISGAASYAIYRTVAGGTPSTTGKIGTSVNNTFSDVGTAGDATTAPAINNSGSLRLPQLGQLYFLNTFRIGSPSGGVVTLDEGTANSGFVRLQLGGTTSSFPAIKRNGTAINFRLADDSADAAITALTIQSTQTTGTAPFTVASTTNVPNLNASSLGGATFAAPGAIGGTTPAAGTFTTLTGKTSVTAGVVGTTSGVIDLAGSATGTATMTGPATAGTFGNPIVFSNALGVGSLTGLGVVTGSTVGGTAVTSITTAGGLVTSASGTSDERLKNHVPYTDGLKAVLGIKPISFTYNEAGLKQTHLPEGKVFIGFSAQNIKSVIPAAVGTEPSVSSDDVWLTVDDRPIMAALVNAVKEQQKQIEELKKQVQELKSPSLSMSTIPVVGSAAAH